MVKVAVDLGTLFPLSLCVLKPLFLSRSSSPALDLLQETLAIAIAGDARS
jgi:hypothetical protein